jgi:serine/threonine-protein kinase RsbT
VNETQPGELRIESEGDIVVARRAVRSAAAGLGFGITDVTRIVTAASELTRNIYHYARSGAMRWRPLNVDGRLGLELVFEDHGPGIPDVARAMEPGYSTSKGLGMGLPGAKRLMDEMSIESKVGKGTKVQVRKWLKR